MKRSLLILSLLLIYSSVKGQKTLISDQELILKYANDTVDLVEMKKPLFLPFVNSFEHEKINEKEKKRIARKRKRYPTKKIKNIKAAGKWISEIYHRPDPYPWAKPRSPGFSFYSMNYYKEVEDGFLIKAKSGSVSDVVWSRRFHNYALFFVGYDHNVLMVNHWEVDLFPVNSFVEINSEDITYAAVDNEEEVVPPVLNIDRKEFLAYLQENIEFPAKAIRMGIQGRIIISFIVERDGKIAYIDIHRALDPLTDIPAKQVIRNTDGYWTAGTQNNEPVAVKVYAEIRFKITTDRLKE